jgi:2-polyprenyl-6-hydroxyphenyl methylase/3-demethylubiquinone-9 3-methyltransferase
MPTPDAPPPPAPGGTVDAAEAARFAALAEDWWDEAGAFAPLHRLNPARLTYIRDRLCAHFARDAKGRKPLAGLTVLDVGAGGGLVAEPLARLGARVTGIDAVEDNVRIAREHASGARLAIDYRCAAAEDLAAEGGRFDAVIALEVIEHVADRDAFLAALAHLVAPSGALILSTINRTPRAFALAIVGAEYVMRWLPRGTHTWSKFVRPSELAAGLRPHGFALADLTGLAYDLATGEWGLAKDISVNYLAFAARSNWDSI